MVNEKEEHYEEEGEYHFSDDQVNYDVEPETAAPKAATTSGLTKEAFLEKFNLHRRKILAAFSLIVLVGVVYKILVPASTAPATEFKQATLPAKPEKMTAAPTVKSAPLSQPVIPAVSQPVASSEPAVPAAASPVIPASPVAQPPSVAQSAPVVQEKLAAPLPQNQPPAAVVVVTSPPPSAPIATATTQTQPSAPVYNMPPNVQQPPVMQTANPVNTPPPPITVDAQTKERIAALEQQNTAMMNLLQTEYAQKIADNETQSNATRGKMEELTKRVNRMETSLNQIMQMLQGATNRPQPSGLMGGVPMMMPMPPNVGTRAAEPRMIYSVQAIIPGRAWLKSESGDTVTVAEGDYLKRYGRVTKIDPYDGIVAIDTGSRVITLSYGVDGD